MMPRVFVSFLLIAPFELTTAWAGDIVISNPEITIPLEHFVSFDGRAVIDLAPLTPISPDSFNINLFNAQFPDWSVVNGGPSPGVFGVTKYFALPSSGTDLANLGGQLELIYDNGVPIPAGEQLQWVQFVNRNINDGRIYPLIDRLPGDPLPFYPQDPNFTSLPGNAHGFYDFSTGVLDFGDPHKFDADLLLVNWDGGKQIAVRDGVHWGWAISSATRGESSGIFSNPVEPCPPNVCTGIGTSAVTWGIGLDGGPPSGMEFKGKSFNPKPNEDFVLGTLEMFNGTLTSSGLPPLCNTPHIVKCEDFAIVNINLDILVAYDNVPEFNQTLEALIAHIETGNPVVDFPPVSPDLFSLFINCDGLSCEFRSGSIHIPEGGLVRKDIIARLLVPGVELPPDAGSPDDVSFEIPAPFREVVLQLEIVGLVDSADSIGAEVPEPTTLVLFGSGVAALGLFSRRRRTKIM